MEICQINTHRQGVWSAASALGPNPTKTPRNRKCYLNCMTRLKGLNWVITTRDSLLNVYLCLIRSGILRFVSKKYRAGTKHTSPFISGRSLRDVISSKSAIKENLIIFHSRDTKPVHVSVCKFHLARPRIYIQAHSKLVPIHTMYICKERFQCRCESMRVCIFEMPVELYERARGGHIKRHWRYFLAAVVLIIQYVALFVLCAWIVSVYQRNYLPLR